MKKALKKILQLPFQILLPVLKGAFKVSKPFLKRYAKKEIFGKPTKEQKKVMRKAKKRNKKIRKTEEKLAKLKAQT